ncbi:MAG: PD-(D/E)XK nuclease family protein [Bacteroidetes bacterium]|nr:PD-(D/E)XK nuclease family protein [Bacteroidota bacterium]
MKTFIDHIAEYLLQHHRQQLDRIVVVFPSRRAGLYLRKSLAALIDKPMIMPRVMAIEDFVYELTGFYQIEPVYLQFELYEVYRNQAEGELQSFAEFIQWGEVVLKEFNELDLAMADPEKLFSYLNETRALSVWNLDGAPLTPFQQNYLHFYNSLSGLYTGLKKSLVARKKPYQGLAYRLLAEKFIKAGVSLPWDHVVLAGFNALTKAEEEIFKKLTDEGMADILWDGDDYYMDDPVNEAGHFLRKNKKVFVPFHFAGRTDHFNTIPKKIEVVGVPLRVGQAKIAGDILQKISEEEKISINTAVILNDEELILPLLNSLPENIGKFNVTMGLPLNQTPLFRLIHKFFDLHENGLKLKRHPDDKLRFYYKDVLAILENPYFFSLLSEEGIALRKSVQDLRESNQVFIQAGELFREKQNDLFSSTGSGITDLFTDWHNSPAHAIGAVKTLIRLLKDSFMARSSELNNLNLDLEYLFHISKILNQIELMVDTNDFVSDIKTLRLILNQVVRTVRIPFYGEPLQGVQVMGMLETRTLDFENLILLSVNEGLLPSGKTSNAFIPYEVKRTFGIPVYEEHNAVVAYHFYRLLQRARKVYLLYNTEANALGGGDKSRFIMQLLHELDKKSPASMIREQIVHLSSGSGIQEDPIVIEKDERLRQRLKDMAKKGFSASGINTYRRCSLQFYFKFVEGINEIEEAEETIEASTLGTVIHEVLLNLYKPYLNNVLEPGTIDAVKPLAGKLIRQSFEKHYPGGDIEHGKNLLIARVADTYVMNFLEHEKKWIRELGHSGKSIRLEHLEAFFHRSYQLETPEGSLSIKLKGIFDRVDRVGDDVRIIDYKTGRVDPADLKVRDWERLTDDPSLEKSFQVLFYRYLYSSSNKIPQPLRSGIISLRNLSTGFMEVVEPDINDQKPQNDHFETVLHQILSDIYNADVPFRQTEDVKVCNYCPFKSLCNRS